MQDLMSEAGCESHRGAGICGFYGHVQLSVINIKTETEEDQGLSPVVRHN